MTADEFVKIVRNGSEKLRVDGIVINTGSKELHGKGMLHISRKRIELDVTISEGDLLPEFKTGIYTKRDSWKLTGIIEDQLHFKCDHIGPTGKRQLSWPGPITRCTFKLHPIDLIPTGLDAMTRVARGELLKQQALNNPDILQQNTSAEIREKESEDDVSFYATLLDYPLLSTSRSIAKLSPQEASGDSPYFFAWFSQKSLIKSFSKSLNFLLIINNRPIYIHFYHTPKTFII